MDQFNPQELEQIKSFLRSVPELGERDPDAGARLHAEKNAPSVSGLYSHLKFPPPPQPPRLYPKMLYSTAYGAAIQARQRAYRIPARGSDDAERSLRIMEAERAVQEAICIVHSAEEEHRRREDWFDTPALAEAAREAKAQAVAQAAAERAYDDRRLGPQAAAELKQLEAEAADHVVEVPAPKRGPGRPRKPPEGDH